MKPILVIVSCLLFVGCAHKAKVPVAGPSHEALSPRLQALIESPARQQPKEMDLQEFPTEGLPDSTVEQFRKRIAALQFPLPAGTVLGLFPYELMWSGRMDGDAFGDPSGYLGGTSTWYGLSPKFILFLRQSHYSTTKHAMITVDDGAEIMTREEADRRWPAPPEEKIPANKSLQGTPGKEPSSSTEPEARRP